MEQQNDYQFVMMPQQLSSCLDANCNKMLSTLIGLHSILSNEDGWFYRSNLDLQDDTRLSETLVRATLDTLYQAGIIDIDCIGKGRGHRSNRIHINFESFKVYQQYSFNDIRNNPDLWINTIKYKGSGFATSYSQKVRTNMEVSQGTSQDISQNTSQKVSTNTDTPDTSNTKENNILNKEEDMLANVIEEKDSFYDDEERNLIMVVEEEKKECSKEELKTIYLNSFGELMNNYPGINYSLIMTDNQDTFLDCYRDIVNELVMKIHLQSQRDITQIEVLKTLKSYLKDIIHFSYQ